MSDLTRYRTTADGTLVQDPEGKLVFADIAEARTVRLVLELSGEKRRRENAERENADLRTQLQTLSTTYQSYLDRARAVEQTTRELYARLEAAERDRDQMRSEMASVADRINCSLRMLNRDHEQIDNYGMRALKRGVDALYDAARERPSPRVEGE